MHGSLHHIKADTAWMRKAAASVTATSRRASSAAAAPMAEAAGSSGGPSMRLWHCAGARSSRCLWRATHMQRDAMTPLGVRLAAFGGEEGSVSTLMRCARQ